MNKPYYLIAVVGIILALAVVFGVFKASRPADVNVVVGQDPTMNDTQPSKADLIVVENIKTGQPISSPVTITGKARGGWYFEASFPVRILDGQGRQIAIAPAQAQSDWMTSEFVRFSVTIPFNTPTTQTGSIVLEKDNPSGMPENSDSLIIPIVFSKYDPNGAAPVTPPVNGTNNQTIVKIFLGRSSVGAECEKVVSTNRTIAQTATVGRAALEELLKGPTQQEISMGYTTAIPTNVKINSLTITNGVARVDFSKELDQDIGGSCRVGAIRSQITETLRQFPTVTSVAISIEGRSGDVILQP